MSRVLMTSAFGTKLILPTLWKIRERSTDYLRRTPTGQNGFNAPQCYHSISTFANIQERCRQTPTTVPDQDQGQTLQDTGPEKETY